VPLAEVPVYVRAGSVIPTQDPDQPPHASRIDPLILEVYPPLPGGSGSSVLYEDDGQSNEHQRVSYCRTHFTLERAISEIVLRGALIEGAPLAAHRTLAVHCYGHVTNSAARCNGEPVDVEQADRAQSPGAR